MPPLIGPNPGFSAVAATPFCGWCWGCGGLVLFWCLLGAESSRVSLLAPLDKSGEHHEEKEEKDRVDRERGDPGAAVEPEVEVLGERDAKGVDREHPDNEDYRRPLKGMLPF